jgi:hypothetical protein
MILINLLLALNGVNGGGKSVDFDDVVVGNVERND